MKWARQVKANLKRLKSQAKAVYESVSSGANKDLSDEIRDYTLSLLEQTTEHWRGGGDRHPVPDFDVQTQRHRDGSYTMRFTTNSYLWNLLDQGTEGMIIKSKTPGKKMPVKIRINKRTTPGTLTVGAGATFGPTIYLSHVRGYPGRGWSKLVADKVREKYADEGVEVRVD